MQMMRFSPFRVMPLPLNEYICTIIIWMSNGYRMSVILNKNNRLQLPQDVRPQIGDEQYCGLQPYIDSARAFAQITYKSLYIIDYNRMNFLYVSDNPLFLCGESVATVQQEGYDFYYNHVPEEDLEFLTQVNRAGFDFFKGIAVSERTQYTISYNFRVNKQESKERVLINHQITPLKLDSMGNIWLALCLVSLAPSQERGVAYMTAVNSNTMWQFSSKMCIRDRTLPLSKSWRSILPKTRSLSSTRQLAISQCWPLCSKTCTSDTLLTLILSSLILSVGMWVHLDTSQRKKWVEL